MGENYVRSEFKIVAEIDGKKFRDVVSISATFGLNSIPTATLQVATGREVNTEEYATIHTALPTLRTRSKAKVTLTVKTTAGQKDKMMEDGDYVIFEGYYSGTGYQRSTSNSTFTIHLIHWIDDLNCSSMLNGNWFQGAPHNMASAAGCYALEEGSGAAAPGLAGAVKLVNKGNMESDFWEDVIKPVFEKIAALPHPNDGSPNGVPGQPANMAGDGGVGGADNKAAMDALKRMPGDSPVPGRLPLDLTGLDDILISYSATMGITHMFTNGMGYSSFWGKLVGELGSSFLFAVSPSAEFANVIPYFGGLAMVDGVGGDQPIIAADDYNYASFNCNVANLIESVDIFYAQQASSGYGNGGSIQGGKMTYYEPWGRFPKKNRDFRGHILVRDPPAWIANCVPQAIACPGTTLPPNGDAHVPQHGKQTGSGKALNAIQSEQNVKNSRVLDRYAEHWFKTAVLSQRTGELSGKLRFDISPGCTVKIEAPDTALGAEKLDLYASVTQVSFVVNAEQHVAGTSFTFTNVRNQHENQDQNLVSSIPPMYKRAWNGCPLAVKT